MKKIVSKIWFPTVLVSIVAIQSFGFESERRFRINEGRDSIEVVKTELDTSAADSISAADGIFVQDSLRIADSIRKADSLHIADSIHRADSIIKAHTPPDSLRLTDTLKFKYYKALKDTVTRAAVRDSLRSIEDSLELHRLDSLVYKDSSETAYLDSIAYVNSLSKKDKKKYLLELKTQRKIAEMDSILRRQDSLKAVKDSIVLNTPRILETYVFQDSMKYKRMIRWDHDRYFNNINLHKIDTTYNYYFNDYPFMRQDVNATYLGVIGSPVETYNYFKREEAENAIFHTPYLSYNYTPENLPMYNTKTPYTELAYWGTLFANTEKEETNVRILTTQNILPEWNIALEYNRFGGNGMLKREDVDNRTFVASTNYTGKRYLMHAGYISHKIEKSENGGIIDNYWIRDTTVDPREINVKLAEASNLIKKKTVFLDQSYRIPFSFINKLGKEARKEAKADKALRDSLTASGDSTALAEYYAAKEARKAEEKAARDTIDNEITTAFIGHSSEFSVFSKIYEDRIGANDTEGRDFYDNKFYINPTTSLDSLRVMKLDNRIFFRLQPWADDGIVSKLDVGIGDKLLNYYNFDRTSYIKPAKNVVRNSLYLYAGAQGQLKKYIHWNATGRYTFLGQELNDFGVDANLSINLYPFRRHKDSPLNLDIHFETNLKEPDYYQQHLHTNHYWWDNDFGKISTTKAEAMLNIPIWKLSAGFSYGLLSNNIYLDNYGIIRQNNVPMSVMTASVIKNFRLWKFHFDHQALLQFTSDKDVLPLPLLALNFRYYFQFDVVKNVMQMQIGANATYTTKWHAPAYSPALGLFHNQNDELYGNCPYIDVFVNIQWKRACIFIKGVNMGMGWPNNSADYFSAHHYIRPPRTIKFGIFWPFYVQPNRNARVGGNAGAGSNAATGGGNMSSGSGGLSRN